VVRSKKRTCELKNKTKMSKNIEKQYLKLLKDILKNGVEKQDRTGTGTISVFGRQIRHDMSKGFPLLTTKKMYWKGIVTELLWFLRGDTNIKYLVDNDCHVWDGDAYKNYCMSYKDGHEFYEDDKVKRSYTKEEFINKIKTDDEFAKKWGELGPVYGKQWRDWEYYCGGGDCNVDQIQNSINLLKTDPDSRRNIISAWNVGELDKMTLPPCHNFFQFYTRELTIKEKLNYVRNKWPRVVNEDGWNNLYVDSGDAEEWLMTFGINEIIPQRAISLMWNQRSVDTFLGLPFNIASYGLLLEIIAKEVNMVPDELIGNLGDCHLYKNHIEQAKEQMTREPMKLPKLIIDQFDETNHYIGDMDDISEYNIEQFKLENYQSHPTIKAPLSN
jgi:thymidylate synthase